MLLDPRPDELDACRTKWNPGFTASERLPGTK